MQAMLLAKHDLAERLQLYNYLDWCRRRPRGVYLFPALPDLKIATGDWRQLGLRRREER
jgi:hypothetical protein